MTSKLLAVLAVVALAFAPPAHAAPDAAPDELVQRISNEVLDIVRTDPGLKTGDTSAAIARVEKVVLPHFNFRRMASLAVGPDWRSATPAQQQQIADGFYGLLVRTYSNALTNYKDQTVRFRPFKMEAGAKTVRVQSEIVQAGAQPIPVDYVLSAGEDGWKVFDIVISGGSLVTTYRDSFAEQIRSGGMDGLIRWLQSKAGEPVEPVQPAAAAKS